MPSPPLSTSVSHFGPFGCLGGLGVVRTRLWLDGQPRGQLAWVASVDDWPTASRGRLLVPTGLAKLRSRAAVQPRQLALPLGQPLQLGSQALMLLGAGWPGASQLQLHTQGETWLIASCSRLDPFGDGPGLEVRESAQVLLHCPPVQATSALGDLTDWLGRLRGVTQPVVAVASPGQVLAVAAAWPGGLQLSRRLRAALRGWDHKPIPAPDAGPMLRLVGLRDPEATAAHGVLDPTFVGPTSAGLAFSVAAAGAELDRLCARLSPQRLVVWGDGAADFARRHRVDAVLHVAGQLPLLHDSPLPRGAA